MTGLSIILKNDSNLIGAKNTLTDKRLNKNEVATKVYFLKGKRR